MITTAHRGELEGPPELDEDAGVAQGGLRDVVDRDQTRNRAAAQFIALATRVAVSVQLWTR